MVQVTWVFHGYRIRGENAGGFAGCPAGLPVGTITFGTAGGAVGVWASNMEIPAKTAGTMNLSKDDGKTDETMESLSATGHPHGHPMLEICITPPPRASESVDGKKPVVAI